jgi:hypothetical protein
MYFIKVKQKSLKLVALTYSSWLIGLAVWKRMVMHSMCSSLEEELSKFYNTTVNFITVGLLIRCTEFKGMLNIIFISAQVAIQSPFSPILFTEEDDGYLTRSTVIFFSNIQRSISGRFIR